MGCDIHLYVEYKKKGVGDRHWLGFGNGFRLDRNYSMFGILSKGVRSEFKFSYPQRGMPEDAGTTSLNDNRIFISETPSDEYVTLEKAKQYESHGCKISYRESGEAIWVTHPDWHSHSWLTLEEFKGAIESYTTAHPDHRPVDYEAVLASMKCFDDLGYDTRIVFWFDN